MASQPVQTVPLSERLALTYDETCQEVGCGRTTLHKLISTGALPARKLGTRTVVLREDLVAFLSSLPKARAA